MCLQPILLILFFTRLMLLSVEISVSEGLAGWISIMTLTAKFEFESFF